jgi:murein DD-endopeptidase MepM/ murein hydrolase activator NlpD
LHTGDDLILYDPATNTRQDCAHQPVFAIASGTVISAAVQPGSWGNVIVVQHDPLITTGQVICSRYGHVDPMVVKTGDRVVRGQYIANVGNAFGRFAYHLHFDVSPTQILFSRPWDWPGTNKTRLEANYISPYKFLIANRPAKS